jgi:hypothetical protein
MELLLLELQFMSFSLLDKGVFASHKMLHHETRDSELPIAAFSCSAALRAAPGCVLRAPHILRWGAPDLPHLPSRRSGKRHEKAARYTPLRHLILAT